MPQDSEPSRIKGGGPDAPAEIEGEEDKEGYFSEDDLEYDEYPGLDGEDARKSGSWRYKPPPNSPLGKAPGIMKQRLTASQGQF